MAQQGIRRVRIRKGDQVVVIAGRDNGKRGRVLEVEPRSGRVKVEGVAIVKKHQRANPSANRGGGIIDREAFINISNVQLIDPQSQNAVGPMVHVYVYRGAAGVPDRVGIAFFHLLKGCKVLWDLVQRSWCIEYP